MNTYASASLSSAFHTRTRLSALLFLAAWFGSICLAASETLELSDLEKNFVHPPDSCRPWVNWFWMDGNITKEGITADLEAMQRVGIGGALLMDVSQGIPKGPIRFGSPEWFALFHHAATEATRLGLKLSVNNDPG